MLAVVSGSKGFIGHHLVRELIKSPHISGVIGLSRRNVRHLVRPLDRFEWLEIKCDIEDYSEVKHIFQIAQPDIVFHFAANPITKENESDPTAITKTNVLGTHNLLAAAKPNTRFVLASSATVYGTNHGVPHKETDHFNPDSPYAATKIAAEVLCQSYCYKINPLMLRLVANVGSGATHGLLPDLISKLLSDSPTLDLLGDFPGSSKQYIYVKDTVKAAVKFGLNNSISGPLNIAPETTTPLTINSIATIVMDTIGIKKPIKWLGASANWRGDSRLVYLDNALAERFGYSPQCSTNVSAIIKATKDLFDGKHEV